MFAAQSCGASARLHCVIGQRTKCRIVQPMLLEPCRRARPDRLAPLDTVRAGSRRGEDKRAAPVERGSLRSCDDASGLRRHAHQHAVVVMMVVMVRPSDDDLAVMVMMMVVVAAPDDDARAVVVMVMILRQLDMRVALLQPRRVVGDE